MPAMTYDLDLRPGWEPANLDRLAAALRELGARLRELPPDVEFPPITGKTLREMMIGTWRTSAGDLDILREIPSGDRHHHPNSYDELVRRAASREVLGCTIYVADLADIVTSKEVVDRPRDREALPELRALLAAQARTAPSDRNDEGAAHSP